MALSFNNSVFEARNGYFVCCLMLFNIIYNTVISTCMYVGMKLYLFCFVF